MFVRYFAVRFIFYYPIVSAEWATYLGSMTSSTEQCMLLRFLYHVIAILVTNTKRQKCALQNALAMCA
jgi:hypothetical protein